MREIQFVYKSDKDRIIERLEYYGIKQLPFLLSLSGQEKIRGYTGMLSTKEIFDLNKNIGLEIIGLYLFHSYENQEVLRLSFDAISALKDHITKNILDINDEQSSEFLKGRDILLTKEDEERLKAEPKGFKIIRHKGEFLGSGKLGEGRITNFMPKERRLR